MADFVEFVRISLLLPFYGFQDRGSHKCLYPPSHVPEPRPVGQECRLHPKSFKKPNESPPSIETGMLKLVLTATVQRGGWGKATLVRFLVTQGSNGGVRQMAVVAGGWRWCQV